MTIPNLSTLYLALSSVVVTFFENTQYYLIHVSEGNSNLNLSKREEKSEKVKER